MANLGECRNNVLNELYKTGSLTAEAHTAIQAACDFYKRKTFWFNEERATNNTQDGVEYYELPSDYAQVISVNINVNNNVYRLHERTHEEMERRYIHSTNYKGEPEDFSIIRNELRLGPIPSSARTLTMVYRKNPATLTASGNVNFFLNNAEVMIRRHAAADLAMNILRDPNRAQGFSSQARMEYENLRGESSRRLMRGSGKRRR